MLGTRQRARRFSDLVEVRPLLLLLLLLLLLDTDHVVKRASPPLWAETDHVVKRSSLT